MARKLNRSETEQLARQLARKNANIAAQTYDQIVATSWEARNVMASELAQIAYAAAAPDTRYPEVFTDNFRDEATKIWGNVIRQRDNARRTWQRALESLTPEQAETKAAEFLKSLNVRGALPIHGRIFSIARRSSYGDAEVRWSFDPNRANEAKLTNPDDPTQSLTFYTLDVRVGTSGSNYAPNEAAVVARALGDAVMAAQELEVAFQSVKVASRWGFQEPQPVAEPVAVTETL